MRSNIFCAVHTFKITQLDCTPDWLALCFFLKFCQEFNDFNLFSLAFEIFDWFEAKVVSPSELSFFNILSLFFSLRLSFIFSLNCLVPSFRWTSSMCFSQRDLSLYLFRQTYEKVLLTTWIPKLIIQLFLFESPNGLRRVSKANVNVTLWVRVRVSVTRILDKNGPNIIVQQLRSRWKDKILFWRVPVQAQFLPNSHDS